MRFQTFIGYLSMKVISDPLASLSAGVAPTESLTPRDLVMGSTCCAAIAESTTISVGNMLILSMSSTSTS